MDFLMFSSKKEIDVVSIKKQLDDIDYYGTEQGNSGVFHVAEISKDIIHAIFYINDELRTQSKYISKISTTPLQVYINAFIFVNNGKLFIQNLQLEYCDEIISILKHYTGIEFIQSAFQENTIKNIITNKAQDISKCEFESEEIVIKTTETKADTVEYMLNNQEYDKIYYICFNYCISDKILITVSLTMGGKVNIKSNIPNLIMEVLTSLIEVENE